MHQVFFVDSNSIWWGPWNTLLIWFWKLYIEKKLFIVFLKLLWCFIKKTYFVSWRKICFIWSRYVHAETLEARPLLYVPLTLHSARSWIPILNTSPRSYKKLNELSSILLLLSSSWWCFEASRCPPN